MISPIHLLMICEEDSDAEIFKSLPPLKKMLLLVGLMKREVIKTQQEFSHAMEAIGWSHNEFLKQFEELWMAKKIGWEELDVLDSHKIIHNGPNILSDRTLEVIIGKENICPRIPPKYHDQFPMCKGFAE